MGNDEKFEHTPEYFEFSDNVRQGLEILAKIIARRHMKNMRSRRNKNGSANDKNNNSQIVYGPGNDTGRQQQ